MTTGEPVVVRCAMKPLPTLTKPLRSVDIATREPAQALRERTDSCTVPAAGVVGEAMLAIVLASACRDKFGGDHIDDVRTAMDAYTRRIGWHAALSSLVFIGFMGAGKTSAARAAGAALGARAVDSDHVLEERLGCSIEEYFATHGERAFRAAEEDVVAEMLEHPPSPVLSLGGGAIGSERVRGLLERHTVVLLDVDEDTAWRRAGGRRPLARDRSRFAALLADRRPLYDSIADAVLPDSSRDVVRRAVPALRALARRARGHEAAVGDRRVGRVPGLRRRGPDRLGLPRAGGRRPRGDRRVRRRALRRRGGGRLARDDRAGGDRPRRWRRPGRCSRRWPRPGSTTTAT